MQPFLQFRLGSHQLPVVLGRFAGGQHVARPNRVCIHCDGVAVAHVMHMIFECPALMHSGSSMLLCFPQTPIQCNPFEHTKIPCKFSSLLFMHSVRSCMHSLDLKGLGFWTVLMSSKFDPAL